MQCSVFARSCERARLRQGSSSTRRGEWRVAAAAARDADCGSGTWVCCYCDKNSLTLALSGGLGAHAIRGRGAARSSLSLHEPAAAASSRLQPPQPPQPPAQPQPPVPCPSRTHAPRSCSTSGEPASFASPRHPHSLHYISRHSTSCQRSYLRCRRISDADGRVELCNTDVC